MRISPLVLIAALLAIHPVSTSATQDRGTKPAAANHSGQPTAPAPRSTQGRGNTGSSASATGTAIVTIIAQRDMVSVRLEQGEIRIKTPLRYQREVDAQGNVTFHFE